MLVTAIQPAGYVKSNDPEGFNSEVFVARQEHALHEKCPNTGISPYSVWMWENTDHKKTPYLDIFHAVTSFEICQNL